MEEEITCGKCKKCLTKPLNLPCSHNVCYLCAPQCISQTLNNVQQRNQRKYDSKNSLTNQNINDRSDCQSDDSGYLSMQEIHACLHQQLQDPISSIKCPKCNVSFILDDRGIDCLPKNVILEALVEKEISRNAVIDCQLCENKPPAQATVSCEQCRVSYCNGCLAIYHPKRGPLASHSLIHPNAEKIQQKQRGVLKCTEHEDENISMYCMLCKMPVCYLCFEEGRHCGHEAKALGTIYKEQKNEMMKVTENLTKKSNELEDFIKSLATQVNKVQENGVDFESRVVAQIDDIIANLEKKKNELLGIIATNVVNKVTDLTDQRQSYSSKLKSTKALLKYVDEVIKENDPAIFLMISNALCSRLAHHVETWVGKNGLKPVVTSETELELCTSELLEVLTRCTFQKASRQKKIEKPGVPSIISDECSVDNNTLTLVWCMPNINKYTIDGYNIDVDDGLNGNFQTVHQTDEKTCILGGLQFKSVYRARVQAYNGAGAGPYSEVIYLTTPDVAMFSFNKELSHADICFSKKNKTMTTLSSENRVALGDVGFSRGVHYWEVTIDRYEGNPDPAIGIAEEDCAKDTILGKDAKAWSIYVDNTRSWFQHNNAHLYRSEGGVTNGSTIGLLLDLEQCQLTFYCNDEKHGPIEFPSLEDVDVVYPAFSLNRNVTMTLSTGISPPDLN